MRAPTLAEDTLLNGGSMGTVIILIFIIFWATPLSDSTNELFISSMVLLVNKMNCTITITCTM